MSDIFWQWDRVEQAIDWLMTGDGDLHYRLSRAWGRMGQPFHSDRLPAELRPVYGALEGEMRRLTSKSRDDLSEQDRTEEAQIAKSVLRFYRYLTEHRAMTDPTHRLSAEDIMKKDGPAMLIVGPSPCATHPATLADPTYCPTHLHQPLCRLA